MRFSANGRTIAKYSFFIVLAILFVGAGSFDAQGVFVDWIFLLPGGVGDGKFAARHAVGRPTAEGCEPIRSRHAVPIHIRF